MGTVTDTRETIKGAKDLVPLARTLGYVAIGGIIILTAITITLFFVYLERQSE